MSHITTCPICGRAYMASSEESANSPDRECYECWDEVRDREHRDSHELDRRIEADEIAAAQEHGAPDEEDRP